MRGKPYLTKLVDKSGNLKSDSWYIEWSDEASGRNKRRSTGYRIGAEDNEANQALATFVLEKNRPTQQEPDQLLVRQALRDYWDEHLQHTPSAYNAQWMYKRLETSNLIDLFVGQVTQSRIDEFVRTSQKKGISNGTIIKDLGYLKASFNHEERERRLLWVPKFKMPPAPPPRERTLTEDELIRIITQCKTKHIRDSIILMVNTGQRPGAISGLKWSQIDFKDAGGRGVIHFQKNGKQLTNKRVRPVTMNTEVRELLTDLYKIQRTDYVIEYIIKNQKGDIVKSRPAGNIRKAFAKACSDAGVEGASRYTLRHTFANLCETDDKTRSDIMGHTQTRTTQHHYLKVNLTKQGQALDNLPRLRQFADDGLRKNNANENNANYTIPLEAADLV